MDLQNGVRSHVEECLPTVEQVGDGHVIHCYTDGSFDDVKKHGAWAVACVVEQACRQTWVGYLSACCYDCGRAVSNNCTSAVVTECLAIVPALLIGLSTGLEVVIHYDCERAASVTQMLAACEHPAAQAAAAIAHIHMIQ